jgi:hypothetical protein
MPNRIIICICTLLLAFPDWIQGQIGINTDPQRQVHIEGYGNQYARLRSTSFGTAETGIELNRGNNDNITPDWRMINDGGAFKIQRSTEDFNGSITDVLRINPNEEVGIGTISPSAPLHIDGGTSIASGGGYLMLGTFANNIAFDNREIASQQNGGPSTLFIQPQGGNTQIGLDGGHTYMALGESSTVGVGNNVGQTKLEIHDNGYQLSLRNPDNGMNDWYIGASEPGWFVGGDQLIFSPTTSSNDAVLRLMDVDDNNGNTAPVMIHTTEAQTLLLDGNEIDTRNASMYINHNSDNNTYFNSNGGHVGIGTSNPQATLHIQTPNNLTEGITLQRNSTQWHLSPSTFEEKIYVRMNNSPMAQMHGNSGSWEASSDRNMKKNITPLDRILDKVVNTNSYTYSFKHDLDSTRYIGVIAQELMEQFPELVFKAEDQYGVSYDQLATVALKAIQEQQELIEQLKLRVASIKETILTDLAVINETKTSNSNSQ